MGDEPAREVSESARRIAQESLMRALKRCDYLGVAWDDFYQAVLAEERIHPGASLVELYERAIRRLEALRN